MRKHNKNLKSKQTVKSNDTFTCIEYNKNVITRLLSKNTTKRLNNFNWLRHEISFTEAANLFYRNNKDQAPYFDHSCTRGLGQAYDYILEHASEPITFHGICQIHYLICNESNVSINDSFIHAGIIRKTNIPMEIESALNDVICESNMNDKAVIFKAFDLHYNIILLQPFDDYNKRTSRIIMNWFLIQHGYRPIAFTRKTDKKQYPESLLKMKQGDAKTYYRYMMKSMLASQEKIIAQLRTSQLY